MPVDGINDSSSANDLSTGQEPFSLWNGRQVQPSTKSVLPSLLIRAFVWMLLNAEQKGKDAAQTLENEMCTLKEKLQNGNSKEVNAKKFPNFGLALKKICSTYPTEKISQKASHSPLIIIDPDAPVRVYSKNLSFPISSVFEMEGTKLARGAIGGINGMGNTFDEAQDHCRYLKLLSSNHHIEWTHNCSHSIPLDIAETLFFNFQGFSAPAKFLKENWEKFHKSHANDPDAKYLQFCHSQGALHVRNALSHVSKEIRDRVTVVAIAPATIIPKKLCYDSFNYVSKSDPIPALETTWLIGFEAPPPHTLAIISQEAFKELLILEPHPEARGWDHGFQSTTFREIIKKHLEKHITEYGTIK